MYKRIEIRRESKYAVKKILERVKKMKKKEAEKLAKQMQLNAEKYNIPLKKKKKK